MSKKITRNSHGSKVTGPEPQAHQDTGSVTQDPVPATDPNWPRDLNARLNRLGKASLEVTVELGRTRLPLEQVLSLEAGGLVELDRLCGNPVDVRVNGTLFGRGEVVVMGEQMGVRMVQLIRPEEME